MNMQHYGDNFILVVPEAHPLHTAEHPFCYNDTCDCHEDQELVSEVNAAVTDGLLTLDEATALIAGRTI